MSRSSVRTIARDACDREVVSTIEVNYVPFIGRPTRSSHYARRRQCPDPAQRMKEFRFHNSLAVITQGLELGESDRLVHRSASICEIAALDQLEFGAAGAR
jgi:hypothetical protein